MRLRKDPLDLADRAARGCFGDDGGDSGGGGSGGDGNSGDSGGIDGLGGFDPGLDAPGVQGAPADEQGPSAAGGGAVQLRPGRRGPLAAVEQRAEAAHWSANCWAP